MIDLVIDAGCVPEDLAEFFEPAYPGSISDTWRIATTPYSGAHFATMPPALAERCIKAGSKPGDTVLDPFAGAGTTILVSERLGRNSIGIELNPSYCDLARDRVSADAPLFAEVAD